MRTFTELGKQRRTSLKAELGNVLFETKVTYGNVVRPISRRQVYFERLTAHGYSQYGNIKERISKQIVGTSGNSGLRRGFTAREARAITLRSKTRTVN